MKDELVELAQAVVDEWDAHGRRSLAMPSRIDALRAHLADKGEHREWTVTKVAPNRNYITVGQAHVPVDDIGSLMAEEHNLAVAAIAGLREALRPLALRSFATEPYDIHCLLCHAKWSKHHEESHAPGCLAAKEGEEKP